jgi:voltage-gated potassium channel Kch
VNRRDIERITEDLGREVEDWLNHQDAPTVPESVPIMYVSFDGTSAPMRRQELEGRKGKQPDGTAKGREVKLGCIFTQTETDKKGYPLRDEHSTTYVGGIESSALFGERIYQEAVRRGIEKAKTVVALTDGAAYNKTIIQTHFPDAVHIIDLYHAREHLHHLAKLCRAEGQWPVWKDFLDAGDVDALLAKIKKYMPRSGPRRKEAIKESKYFEKNRKHMKYAEFRRKKYFIGSGVIEAGCRTVVGERLKKTGMFWSVRGAHAVLQIRCCILSKRFEQFWDDRAAA